MARGLRHAGPAVHSAVFGRVDTMLSLLASLKLLLQVVAQPSWILCSILSAGATLKLLFADWVDVLQQISAVASQYCLLPVQLKVFLAFLYWY